jgi:polyhydroxyalkanoate synthesis regulator phasin
MATKRKKDDSGTFGRLASRGEEAAARLIDELGRNPRVTEALERAVSAKGRLDSGARSALGTIGLAAADELEDLRKKVERLEKRLAKLEAGGTRSATRKSASSKGRTTKKKTSPSAGRALGGGTARGSSSAGGSAASR